MGLIIINWNMEITVILDHRIVRIRGILKIFSNASQCCFLFYKLWIIFKPLPHALETSFILIRVVFPVLLMKLRNVEKPTLNQTARMRVEVGTQALFPRTSYFSLPT